MFINFCVGKPALFFAAGAVTTLAVCKILQSDCVHNAVVDIVACGMKIKEDAQAKLATMKEEAEKIFDEACCKNQEQTEAQTQE